MTGAEDCGENDELGLEVALLTLRRLAKIKPRLHANYLHTVGIFPIVIDEQS